MELTATIQAAFAYADKDVTIYETIELLHSSWGSSIKLVDSPHAFTATEGTFQPVTIKSIIPEIEASVRGQMGISISFLPIDYKSMIFAASQESDPIYIDYRQYIEGDSDPHIEFPVSLTVDKVDFTDTETIISALYPDLPNILICRRTMNTTELPGLRVT